MFTNTNTKDQKSQRSSPKCRAKDIHLHEILEPQLEGTEFPLKGLESVLQFI